MRWPGDARLALSIVVNVEEGAEQNIRDGDKGPEPVDELQAVPHKPIRAHGNETNYQYGLIEGAPRVLALLDAHKARATWTAAGLALERAPDLARAIAARGDEVCCHGWRWVHQFQMEEAEERDFIRKGRDAILRATGSAPVGWLSRYLHTDNTRRLLVEEGFTYHMDDFSRDAPFWERVEMSDGSSRPMVILPYALDTNDMKFWLTPAYSPQDWLRYAIDSFDWLYEEGATRPRMMSLGLHLRIIGRPGRIGALKAFLEHAATRPGVWIASRAEIAQALRRAGRGALNIGHPMAFTDQTILITGGRGGIGGEVSRHLAAKGATVIVSDRHGDGPRIDGVRYATLDVTSEASWTAAIADIVSEHGKLDGLVNVAGVFTPGIPFEDMTLAQWRYHMDVNLDGTFMGCRSAMQAMAETGGGAIVNFSSGLAEIMLSDAAAYCVSKAAVVALTRLAAKAGGKHRVRVNAVLPGAIDTPMLWGNLREGQDPQALIDMLVKQHPIGRIGQTTDIAQAVAFLLDPENSFVTGAMLAVDGGQLVD